jgi:transcriptional regulator with XRE-family HTH domain
MNSNAEIGLAIKTFRINRKYTSKYVATACGLAVTTYSKIETGKQTLSFTDAIKICNVLKITTIALMDAANKLRPLAIEMNKKKKEIQEAIKKLEEETTSSAFKKLE